MIVFSDGVNALGLMVDQIRDIMEEPLVIRSGTQRSGVLGTAIIDGKATDVVDTQYYLAQTNPQWFKKDLRTTPRRFLIVVESLFFRQLVRTACEAAGFRATVVESLARAEEALDHSGPFDAIVCDADADDPRMTRFSEWARRGADGDQRPIVAMTGVDCPEHRASLEACGCDVVLTKFNPQQLTAALKDLSRQQSRFAGASA
ncbi:MAG: hypothetical protein B7Z55_06580 [Planctomycetales bacterium 12-60-4]|nr:MAG: hypothetical protein B7Z55_06580 [Planctomycetales bacterium 12-60-4]